MTAENQKIYDSGPSKPSDDFWLKHGQTMLTDSLPSIRSAAKSLMTGLGLLKAIYLGILGFADLVPKDAQTVEKAVFVIPLLIWLYALYNCLYVMMTQKLNLNLHCPDDIRAESQAVLKEKQNALTWAFCLLALGLIAATVLLLLLPLNL
jgi:hypothetical protein